MCWVVSDGSEGVEDERGGCERRVWRSCCHQALMWVCLVSEEVFFWLC